MTDDYDSLLYDKAHSYGIAAGKAECILETLSDILQVGYFKLTHGKRIFRMAPLHHHLELGGWSEVKLFCVFSGVTLLACVLAFLGVMGR